MIEVIMYFCIGFLSASLIAISITPLIHARAVRLTKRRLENAMPQSMAEIMADKDLQRADFAVSTRRLEITMEKLRESNATQLAEISRKTTSSTASRLIARRAKWRCYSSKGKWVRSGSSSAQRTARPLSKVAPMKSR